MLSGAPVEPETTDAVRVRVPAKINLHLGVGDRRPDGYHELTTVYQAIGLHDEITVGDADRPGVHVEVTGTGAELVPVDENNLAVAAVRLLAEHAGVVPAVRLAIHKRIPVAGGLAGGSADAAGALLATTRLWRLPLDRPALLALAARLGSDVPFCLVGGTALGTGHGEVVTEVPTASTGWHWVVVAADGSLSTPAVYRELDRLRDNGIGAYSADVSELRAALLSGGADALAPLLRNDMTEAAVSLRPGLREVLAAGEADGAVAALVSGSGPTVLLLAHDEHHAAALAGRMRLRGLARDALVATGPVQGAHLW